ncbi:MAG: SLBB domain-containing protein, partial [Bacteroidota bacterium]
ELGIPLEKYLSTPGNDMKTSDSLMISPDSLMTDKNETREEGKLEGNAGAARKRSELPVSKNGLRYFGYDVFLEVPPGFEPSASGPADPEYVIGSEDVIRISVWGQVEFQNELRVDKEGRIFIPTVGQVLVSGLTLERAQESLKRQMSRSYSGLVAQPPTVWLDVTVSRLRPKRIFVMGEVEKPGGYTVGSYATVFNSLHSVGGPTVKGSLRDIRVIRGNKLIARVDLYDYLTGADQTNDIRVQNNDIIFVSVRGKTVEIRGEVRRPAVYELKEGENLQTLLRVCGGVLPTAYDGNAQIDRIKPMAERTGVEDRRVVDVGLQGVLAGSVADVPLYDADEVQVFSVLDEKRNYVMIGGSVWRPGRYELGEVKTLRELIAAARGVQPKTYMGFAHLTRLNPDMLTREIISFNLQALLDDPQFDQVLMPRDSISIYSTEIIEVKDRFVSISGSVKRPGRYPLSTNMTLKDIIPLAGGYTEDAELLAAEVSRVLPRGLSGDSLAIILHPLVPTEFSPTLETPPHPDEIGGGNGGDFLLAHRDEILVKPNPNFVTQLIISIEGDVRYPGVYSLQRRAERLSEILERAGGPTQTSYMGGARFYRLGKRLLLDFSEAFVRRNPLHDIVLLQGDSIFIPSKPHTVQVRGEVNNAGLLSFIDGDDVMDYLNRAGGLTDSSNYAVLVKPSGESRRVDFGWLSSNPEVPEGSTIDVLKLPPPSNEGEPVDVAATVKDLFAILTSAVTVAFIIWQTTK